MNTFWVLFLFAVIVGVTAVENKKPKSIKELGDEIRDKRNLEYSLTLPHAHVASFRSLDRRIADNPSHGNHVYRSRNGHGLLRRSRPSLPAPPYAVQMEPMVQYSQKDPLYDANGENLEDGFAHNEIQAQPKILTLSPGDQIAENNFVSGNTFHHGELPPSGPPYGPVVLPYYDHPEPIIEIIIKESNESLPAPPIVAPPVVKRPKEPVQVFYVKYEKNPHGDGKDVIYDKPIPAITPPSNLEHEHYEEHTTIAPEGLTLPPPPSTTLRAIIRPDSEHYHSDSGVRITFGNSEERGYKHHDNAFPEGHEESAPHVAVAFPQAALPPKSPIPPTQFQKRQQGPLRDLQSTTTQNFQQNVNIKQNQVQHAQQRVQFQANNLNEQHPHNFQHLPLQNSPSQPFRPLNQFSRQPTAPLFSGPPQNPQLALGPQQRPILPPGPPVQRPVNVFPQRPELPRQIPFKQFAQRPFHPGPQPQQFQFNELEYLQQNYHTITTEQLEPPREQQLPSTKLSLNFREQPRQQIPGPFPLSQEEYNKRYQEQLQHLQIQEQRNRQRPPIPTPQLNQGPNFQQLQAQKQNQKPTILSVAPSQSLGPINHQPFNQPQIRPQPQPIPQQRPPIHQGPQPIPQIHQQPIPQSLPHPNQQQLQQIPPQPIPQQRPPIHQGPQPIPQSLPHPNQQQLQQIPPQQPNQVHGGQFIPPGGELIASIPKFEQHLLITPNSVQNIQSPHIGQPQSLPQASPLVQGRNSALNKEIQQQFTNNNAAQGSDLLSVFEQNQREIVQLQEKLRKSEEEQKKLLALTQKSSPTTPTPQVNIQNDQYFILKNQQQSNNVQQNQLLQFQDRNPQTKPYVAHNTNRPPLLSSTGKPLITISSTSPQYSTTTTPKSVTEKVVTEKKEKKKPIEFDLPDEIPDDLREQLLSSGILENAHISVLDYDKIGDVPLESLPPEQLANFYSAGGGLQISGSAPVGSVAKTSGEIVSSSLVNDEAVEIDQNEAGSENIKKYVDVHGKKKDVEMKVVHFNPNTAKGTKIAEKYLEKGAKQVAPVALNDEKYNRYLPLKVNGAQFPLPDVPELKDRKVTSVVVLAPVNYEFPKSENGRSERATDKVKSINFVAGDALKRLVKTPTEENYKKWLEKENSTSPELQSVVLLVTGSNDNKDEKEIFMYDISTKTVSKLSGDLSSAFVEVAETNSLSKDFDQIALADSGMIESSVKVLTETKATTQKSIAKENKYSNHKPVYTEIDVKKHTSTDKSGNRQKSTATTTTTTTRSVSASKTSIDNSSEESKPVNQVLISSGYSRMKMGRAIELEN